MATDRNSPSDLALFRAYLAGFNESGEGFNGEYIGERYRGIEGQTKFIMRLRAAFDRWRAE